MQRLFRLLVKARLLLAALLDREQEQRYRAEGRCGGEDRRDAVSRLRGGSLRRGAARAAGTRIATGARIAAGRVVLVRDHEGGELVHLALQRGARPLGEDRNLAAMAAQQVERATFLLQRRGHLHLQVHGSTRLRDCGPLIAKHLVQSQPAAVGGRTAQGLAASALLNPLLDRRR